MYSHHLSVDDGISIVIPTFNAQELLGLTLGSLLRQATTAMHFEVIVCDDGSSDGTRALCEAYERQLDLHYCYQEDHGFRVARARNMGARRARFDVILFLDAGMLVSTQLLELHLAAHAQRSGLALIGLSYGVNEYDTLHASLLRENCIVDDVDASLVNLSRHPVLQDCRTPFLHSIDYLLERIALPWILFWTGHVSVRKTEFEGVGGFDEWFSSWGGEDVEFGLRLHKSRCSFELLRGVESIHYPHFRDGESKRLASKKNVIYIHEKHKMEETRLMLNHNWQDILVLPQFHLRVRCPPR